MQEKHGPAYQNWIIQCLQKGLIFQMRRTLNLTFYLRRFFSSAEFQGLQKKAGAAFQMLLAGSETSSTTILFTLYELARHPEIQRKLQKEIRDNLRKHNGEMPYDVLHKMEYLDQVFSGMKPRLKKR